MKDIPGIPEIQRRLRALVDYQQREVFGIEVIRWPGWGERCYEIETHMRRPGLSERAAARVIWNMLGGKTYHDALAAVLGRPIGRGNPNPRRNARRQGAK
jgi:hypothetical protein